MGDKTPSDSASTRQSQAEQQVARLEREVESLRARLKTQSRSSTPTTGGRGKLDELEAKSFQFEEQVKDLKYQLSTKQNEASKLQETLTKRTSEYEDKLKRMRGIFAQASKQLDEYRVTITAKEKELTDLKKDAETARSIAEDSQISLAENQKKIERLSAELNSQVSIYSMQIDKLESNLRQTTLQLDQVKSEYQQYKQRANALLQQKASDQASTGGLKTGDLEAKLRQLELENIDKSEQLTSSYKKLSNAEKELELAVEQISTLEKELEIIGTLEKENTDIRSKYEELVIKSRLEKTEFESVLQAVEQRHAATIQLLRSEIKASSRDIEERLAEKESENEDLQRISEHLSNQLTSLREEFLEQTVELQEARARAESISRTSNGTANSMSVLEKDKSGDETGGKILGTERTARPANGGSSLSELLASEDLTKSSSSIGNNTKSGTWLSAEKEKEYDMKLRHLAELLNESEINVQKLLEQEKVLKEEIRKIDRSEKRQDLKVEYLKSVVLKFFEVPTTAREPLIPVISKVLYLSPEEEKQLHKVSVQNGMITGKSGVLW